MRIVILATGRLGPGPERSLTGDYLKRCTAMARQLGFRSVEEIEIAAGGGPRTEGAQLLKRLPADGPRIRLDEAGRSLTSPGIAARLGGWRDAGEAAATFLIGGAEGFSASVCEAVPEAWAFGQQTWPHRLVRVMLAEQIYRAMTILAGSPYHKA